MVEAIEKIYEAFRPYPLGATIEGSHFSVSNEMSEALLKMPLRELTAEQLGQFSLKAMTTWGTEQDFKHFLPRLLELAYVDPLQMDWLETLFGKIALAKWQEWPAAELHAIEEYLNDWWTSTLSRSLRYDGDESADSVLCAIGSTEVDVQPCLNYWLQEPSQSALDHLCAFVLSNFESMRKVTPRLSNEFWRVGSCAQVNIVSWLRSTGVSERLHRDKGRIPIDMIDALWQIDLLSTESSKEQG